MANAFTLFGEISVDTSKLDSGLTRLEKNLNETAKAISRNEQEAKDLGVANNQTARAVDKFNDVVREQKIRLDSARNAFEQKQITAKQYANVLNSVDRRLSQVNGRLKDGSAKMRDFTVATAQAGSGEGLVSMIAKGNLAASAIQNLANRSTDFVRQGAMMSMELDKLTRLMANLDKNFRSPIALKQLQNDFKQLSTELPFTAQQFAAASFTIKSAMGDLDRPQLVEMLRKMGEAAAGSGADVASHSANVIALAKAYEVGVKDIDKFNALIASSFGIALASDVQVAQGFNRLVTSAKSAKVPMDDLIAAMAVLQSSSNNAEENTNNLLNVIAKLGNKEVIKGLREVFNIDRFKNGGKELKSLSEIVTELAANLENLPEAEKLRRINEVFTDQQARIGILALINGIKEYKAQLAEGGDMANFAAKNDLMLTSMESQWTRFTNRISEKQMDIGNSFAEMFRGMDSTSSAGALGIFLMDILDAAFNSFYGKFEAIGRNIAISIVGWFSPETAAKIQQNMDKFGAGLGESLAGWSDDVYQWTLTSQKDSWQKVADTTADANIRAQAEANVKMLNRIVLSEANKGIVAQFEKWSESSKAITAGLKSGEAETVSAAKAQAENLIQEINARLADAKLDEGSRQSLIALGNAVVDEFAKAQQPLASQIKTTINTAVTQAQPQAEASGGSLGLSIVTGMFSGLFTGRGKIYSAGFQLGKSAEQGAKDGVESRSPSKVFFRIGKDVVQGFIDGINAMKASAQASLATLLDIPSLQKTLTGKSGEKLLGFLTPIVQEMANLGKGDMSFVQQFDLFFKQFDAKTQKDLAGVADGIRKFLDEAQKMKTAAQDAKDFEERIKGIKEEFAQLGQLPETHMEKLLRQLADPKVSAALTEAEKTLYRMNAAAADLQNILGGAKSGKSLLEGLTPLSEGMPNPETRNIGAIDASMLPQAKATSGYLDVIKQKMDELQADLPSFSEQLGSSLQNFITGVSDVFANAVANWDGTAKGFFRSLAQGFRQLISQIIAELVRLMVMKAVFSLIGAVGGSAGGGGKGNVMPGGGYSTTFDPGLYMAASGGLIRGPGTGTSDSIPALLSNGEFVMPADSVRKFGVGFFEQLRNLRMPSGMLAMAGGGMVPSMSSVGGGSTSTANYNNVFNINVPSGRGSQETATMVQDNVLRALRKHERRNK